MDLKDLGENIRRERKRLGLTLEKFARLVGTGKTTPFTAC
jgi:transcriptional regulator with XRE-family HTH domain